MALRSVWVDKGDNPDPVKGTRYVLDRPVFDIRDTTLSARKLTAWRQTPPFSSVGVYACASPDWNLDVSKDPKKFARFIDSRLSALGPGTGMRLPCVAANIEKAWVDAAYPGGFASYVTDFLVAWRLLRPTRFTSLVLDGMQGGWWDNRPLDVAAVEAAMLEEIQVECFGATRPNPAGGTSLLDPLDTLAVVENLRARGFSRVVPVHDGYRLNQAGAILGDFYGNVFTQGRLT